MGRTKTINITPELLDKAAENMKAKAIEVRGATLKDLFCNYSYNHKLAPGTVNTVSTKSQVPVHDDLKAAFRKLDAHLAVICEEIPADAISNMDDLLPYDEDVHATGSIEHKVSMFTVNSFRLEGDSDNQSVILVGEKQLTTGDFVKLETPKTHLDSSYPFAHELNIALIDLVGEVEEYMQGKQAPPVQQELFAGEDDYAEADR
ncbi:hypothetical protein SAMN05444008_102407 [Cnuella takakiae]|uniref:Uncharacterized protein n=1 Tax=Cnuella takakiae TaxID=1302690 RepID=A0A1M4VWD0_9BACT|nr:hypothetical protein [Cnuella takakiae]OLY92477.1 hypothetical protein BUE76_11705 [Cnuella takakiae]SHE73311.1 hypothetical protein SAMN05444008_102407 [Cnuella takakiae]